MAKKTTTKKQYSILVQLCNLLLSVSSHGSCILYKQHICTVLLSKALKDLKYFKLFFKKVLELSKNVLK